MNGETGRIPPACVLFDFDGTLVDTPLDFGLMRSRIEELILSDGGDPTRERMDLDILAMIEQHAAISRKPARFLRTAESVLLEIELEAAKHAELMPGASDLLEWLQSRGIAAGIVTRNARPAVESVLRRMPLHHQVLITREEAPRVKPDPLHLLTALRALGAAAADSVMVGDHVMDVAAGKAAGMQTAGFLAPGRAAGYFHQAAPDFVAGSLAELREWISRSSWSTGTRATP